MFELSNVGALDVAKGRVLRDHSGLHQRFEAHQVLRLSQPIETNEYKEIRGGRGRREWWVKRGGGRFTDRGNGGRREGCRSAC